jgi:hypothetical protein
VNVIAPEKKYYFMKHREPQIEILKVDQLVPIYVVKECRGAWKGSVIIGQFALWKPCVVKLTTKIWSLQTAF